MCACPRSRSATCGRARSAPRRSPGWATTRCTMWPRFPARPTARWRWPPRARSSARHPRSATSASSRCCCSTTRPRSPPSRRSRRPASSTSRWRPTEDGERVRRAAGGPARRRGRRPAACARTSPPCSRPTRTGWRAPRCGSGSTRCGIQYGPAFTGLAAAHTAEGTVSTVLAEVGAARPDPLAAGRLRRAPRAAGCLLPVGCGPPRRPERRQRRPAVAAGCALGCAAYGSGPQRPLLLHPGDRSRRRRTSRPTSTCWTSTARSC